MSWRDVYRVHPCADVLPMMPFDELSKMAESFKKDGGLKDPVVFSVAHDGTLILVDGRNRMAALELAGIPFDMVAHGTKLRLGIDVSAYVIAKNLIRRHIPKEQQAEIILNIIKADSDFANSARSFPGGTIGGSTKDPIKEKLLELAKKQNISPRTAERALAKDRGPTLDTPRYPNNIIRPDQKPALSADQILQHFKRFVEDNLADKTRENFNYLRAQTDDYFKNRISLFGRIPTYGKPVDDGFVLK